MRSLRFAMVLVMSAIFCYAQTSSTPKPTTPQGSGTQNTPNSQNVTKGQLYFVEVDHVRPGMIREYRDALKQIIADIRPTIESSNSLPGFSMWSGDDFTMHSLSAIENLSAMDTMEAQWNQLMERLGGKAKSDQWEASINPTIEYTERYFFRRMDAWSYRPDAMGSPEQSPVCMVEHWFLTGSSGDKLDAFAKAYRAVMQQKSVQHGYIAYRGGFGTQQPSVLFVSCGKTRGEVASNYEADTKLAGKEAEDMAVRDFLPMARKVKRFYATFQPDLSIMSAKDRSRIGATGSAAPKK